MVELDFSSLWKLKKSEPNLTITNIGSIIEDNKIIIHNIHVIFINSN